MASFKKSEKVLLSKSQGVKFPVRSFVTPPDSNLMDLAPIGGYWVWYDVLSDEVLSVPMKEATTPLLDQLKKEGVEPRFVLARSNLQAMRLGCPNAYDAKGVLLESSELAPSICSRSFRFH